MALTITIAGVGGPPAATAEPAGPDSAAQTADAFAGVLAGLGQPDQQPGRPGSQAGPSGHRPADPAGAGGAAGSDADFGNAAAELADLAMLALGAPVLPAAPVAASNPGQPATDEPDSPAPSQGGTQARAIGPAPQAATPAQLAAARRPAQAVAAQAAAAAAKAARLAGEPTDPADPAEPADPADPAGSTTPLPTPAGSGPVEAPGQPDHDPTAGPMFPAAASVVAERAVAGKGTSDTTGAATPAVGTPPTSPAHPASPADRPATSASPAVVTLPGTAAAIATTSGAARATDPATSGATSPGTSAQVSTPGAARRGEATPAPGRPVSHAGHRPERDDPIPASGTQVAVPAASAPATADPAATPTGISAVQQPAPTTGAGQPVAAGQNPESVPRHPAADLPLASQVAGPVLALRARGDGTHQMIVALHPAELGPVNVHVRIAGDAMTISLASSNDVAHDTLREALPQLRSELQSAGLGAASLSLDLTSGGSAGSGAFADPRPAPAPLARPVPDADPAVLSARHRASGRSGTSTSSGLDRWL